MPKTFASAASTMCEAFQLTVERRGDHVAVRTAGDKVAITFGEWGQQVRALAAGFAALGVTRGDTVALMMVNRPEFFVIDVALQHLGATPFSIYNTSAPEQLNYYFADSGNTVVVAEEQFVGKVLAGKEGTKVEHVVCIDATPAGTVGLDAVKASGSPDFDFDAAWKAVEPSDTLTLIYTSGTTGSPKGVQLTHANMLAMVSGTELLMEVVPDDKLISFLPAAHIADRWSGMYTQMVVGTQITTVADRKDFLETVVEVRPTVFGAVPQVWQKIKAGVDAKLAEATGVKAKLAAWAIDVGRRASDTELDGKPVGFGLKLQAGLADKLVLSKLRAALGLENAKVALSGAAPIAADVVRFFNGVGIPVSDAWGMSELSGLVTVAPPGKVRVGTVGAPVPGVEIKIDEADGEVLVGGPVIMKGYLNKPEQTADTIDADGWLHTGDVGELDEAGYLKIVDRKKELIINAGGKNMSPSNIENWIKAFSPLIGQAVAIGDNRKYNVALIALDPDNAALFAQKHGVEVDAAALAAHPETLAAVDSAVEQANAKLSNVEQIKKYKIVPDFWEPGSDVLTPTMKLRRKPINERYGNLIDDLYV